jgi:antitoxin component YwqK of YwqJK toxin-antitoxin module
VSRINYQIALACFHAYSTDYRYDAAGNMTFDATASLNYTYDQENRLTGAAGYTYTYDGDGNRVRKSNGNLAGKGSRFYPGGKKTAA